MFKSYRIVDKRPRWVIVNDYGEITNRNPNKEELKGLKKEIQKPYSRGNVSMYREYHHNDTETCDRCGKDFAKLGWSRPLCEYDKESRWTERRVCSNCWQKYDPNSSHNIMKLTTDRRIGNIKLDSNNHKGDRYQKVSCILYNARDLNCECNNYKSPIDHWCQELGYFQTKGRLYDSNREYWNQRLTNEHGKNFNRLVFYCLDKDGEVIERMYIFPKMEIMIRSSIAILKNYNGWYEKYRINDDIVLERANKIYQEILKEELT